MSTNYRKLFSIAINHSYYTNGNGASDFAIRPTAETLKLLNGHGMRFISGDAGNMILYRVNYNSGTGEFDPFISVPEMDANLRLRFYVELKNPYFFNITNLPSTKPLRSSLYFFAGSSAVFSGALTDGDAKLSFLAPDELACRKSAFTYTYTLAGNPTNGVLRLLDEAGNTVREYQSPRDTNDEFVAHVEMTRLKPGKYALQKVNSGALEGTAEAFYFDADLNPAATFGLIEIPQTSIWQNIHDFNAINGNNEAVEANISFAARSEQWIYKIVFKKTPIPVDLLIEPVTIEETWTPVVGNRYHAVEATDKMYFAQDGMPSTFEGYDMLKFKSVVSDLDDSNRNYPLYQETKRNLNLKIDTDTVLGGIPNPDFKNLKNEVIIYV